MSVRQLPWLACLLPAVCAAAGSSAAAPSEEERLHSFFESVFERELARSPMRQSRLGIKDAQDRRDDISEARQIEDHELARGDLRVLSGFHVEKLAAPSRLSYRLFERDLRERVQGFEWRRHGYYVTQMGGIHRRVATTLLNSHPITDRADAQAYVSRLARVKPLLDQLVVELQRQELLRIRPPRFVYDLTIGEAENLVKGRPFDTSDADSPLLADLRTKLAGTKLPAADQAALLAQAETALREEFGPGYRHLIEHLRAAQKTATDEAGVWKLPNGEAYYRFALES